MHCWFNAIDLINIIERILANLVSKSNHISDLHRNVYVYSSPNNSSYLQLIDCQCHMLHHVAIALRMNNRKNSVRSWFMVCGYTHIGIMDRGVTIFRHCQGYGNLRIAKFSKNYFVVWHRTQQTKCFLLIMNLHT